MFNCSYIHLEYPAKLKKLNDYYTFFIEFFMKFLLNLTKNSTILIS